MVRDLFCNFVLAQLWKYDDKKQELINKFYDSPIFGIRNGPYFQDFSLRTLSIPSEEDTGTIAPLKYWYHKAYITVTEHVEQLSLVLAPNMSQSDIIYDKPTKRGPDVHFETFNHSQYQMWYRSKTSSRGYFTLKNLMTEKYLSGPLRGNIILT